MLKNRILQYSKPFMVITLLGIVGIFLWNTQRFFEKFKAVEQQRMTIWAAAQSQFLAADPNAPMGDLVLQIFQSNKETPMLLVQSDGSFTFNNMGAKVEGDKAMNSLMETFASENPPIIISEGNTTLATLYYGESLSLKKLKYYPYGLLFIFSLFGGLLYWVLSLNSKANRNILWASMAKETAHQIATPLSALMAWNELIKAQPNGTELGSQIDKDLERLSMISNRFSSIGSTTVLENTELIGATQEGLAYLENRLGNSIKIQFHSALQSQTIQLNKALYFWCLENLIKNSVDAMKGKGLVSVTLHKTESLAVITVADQGSGILKKHLKQIFEPGYSQKKSGWGMGLSLANRIISDYHGGKLYVGKSSEKGTEMVIELPL